MAGAGLPPEWTHLLPGDSRACSLACSLAVMPASRNARTFSLFSGSSCIMAEKINKCLKPRPPLMKASANTSTPNPAPPRLLIKNGV